jgi:ribosomal protein L4
MNKKARRSALAMAIAAKAEAGTLFIIDVSGLKPQKTKELSAILCPESQTDSVLLVVHHQKDEGAREVYLAGRNLRRADIVAHEGVSAHAILAHDRLLMSRNALDALAEVCRG